VISPDGRAEAQHFRQALRRPPKPAAAPKAAKGKKPRKAAAGQREMLLPISGKRAAKAEEKRAPKEVKARVAQEKRVSSPSRRTQLVVPANAGTHSLRPLHLSDGVRQG